MSDFGAGTNDGNSSVAAAAGLLFSATAGLFSGTVVLFSATVVVVFAAGVSRIGWNAYVPAGGGRFAGVVFCETVSPGFTTGASGSCILTFRGKVRAAAI